MRSSTSYLLMLSAHLRYVNHFRSRRQIFFLSRHYFECFLRPSNILREISRRMSRSIMQTYRNFFLCPPFLKDIPILICDQIKKSTAIDQFLYFETTLGEYISVKLCDVLSSEKLCIVTNTMLLKGNHGMDNKLHSVLDKTRQGVILSMMATLLLFSCCT